jgi:hypothetical protein
VASRHTRDSALYLTTIGVPVVPLVVFTTSANGGAVAVRLSLVVRAVAFSSSGSLARSAGERMSAGLSPAASKTSR